MIKKEYKPSKKRVISRSMLEKKLLRKEAFKPTDKLSPSETAAVVSKWTHNRFSDSWKNSDGESESFQGELKDTFAPMEIYVDKKNRVVSVYYLSLSNEDIKEYVRLGLESHKDPDEAFIEDINNAMSEDFSNEHAMVFKEIDMPVTQIELEKSLDECAEKSLNSYNRLESAFYKAVDGVTESKKNSNRKSLKEARMAGLEDHPMLKNAVSSLKEDDQWALSRAIFNIENSLSSLDSKDEGEVLRALRNILDVADDMVKVRKSLKRTLLGQRMW